jgi:hypothetical protein
MKIPQVKECYTEEDIEQLGFHDCYVSGVRWNADEFEVKFNLGYIVEWVQPTRIDQKYGFWICPAELCFVDVDDLHIDLNWVGQTIECCIQEFHRREKRMTPNGKTQWNWALEMSKPEGTIDLWATGFELKIKGSPVLSDTQRFRQ